MSNVIPFPLWRVKRTLTLYMGGIATATLVLGGCVPVPLGAMHDLSGEHHSGQHCVSRETHVGDRLALPEGGMGEVVRLEGYTYRCRDTSRPIRAKLVPVASV